jgi:DNA-directed RNA polymerase specialized sigma24 family protein
MSNGQNRPAMALGPGESFDTVVLPHLVAAHRLARWLMRDADAAEDVVQEASLRAFRYFRTFVGGDGHAGSSELFATLVIAGAAIRTSRRPTRSMKSNTPARDHSPILKRCCFRPLTPR